MFGHLPPQDIFDLHKCVTMGQVDVMPGCIREECVVVGETGVQNCNFTVFLPANEVSAAMHFLVEVVLLRLRVFCFSHIWFRRVTKMSGLFQEAPFFDHGFCEFSHLQHHSSSACSHADRSATAHLCITFTPSKTATAGAGGG
jgi:hypothetical protein